MEECNKNSGSFIIVNSETKLPINESFFSNERLESSARIAFVDGGNGELLSAPNFSLQLIRIYGSIFSENKIIKRELKEFYVAVTANQKEGKIVYHTQTFDTDLKLNFDFNLHDSTLSSSNHTASPSTVAECIRKFAEIKMAEKMCEYLQRNDLLVRDGELLARVTFENEHLNQLFSLAKAKEIMLCGLSKTTTLLTDAGNSAAAVLARLNKGVWHYVPQQDSQVKIGFMRLAKKSNYVFRTDFFNANVCEAFSLLMKNSQDLAFLGYPYGLVDADLRARVSKEECSNLRIHFLTKFGQPFQQNLASVDAHDILNVIN